MATSREVDDVELCRIYGELARAYYEEPWDACVLHLRAGWLRVRGGSRMDWEETEPLIREGWDSQGGRPVRRGHLST